MKIRQQFGGLIVAIVLVFTGLFGGTAFAAGTANFSVVPSTTSTEVGQPVTLNFYVNASGSNLYGASVDVSLVGMGFSSYAAPSTSAFGFAQVVSGGSTGSPNFTIAVSQQGAHPGAQGSQFMGSVVVSTSSTAMTAQANLSNGQAAEAGTFAPMPGTSGSASVTLTAPPAATPTCAAGQTGTPPNCITPAPPATDTTTPVKAVTNPNPKSTTNVPVAGSDTKSETVPEQTVANAYTASIGGTGGTTATTSAKAKKNSVNLTFTALGAVAIIAILGGAAMLIMRKRKFAGYASHPTSSVFSSSMNDSTPHQPEADSSKDDHHTPSGPVGPSGPTVITPQ